MARQKKVILAVDDDPGILRLLEKRLEADNYQVIKALNGRIGIQLAREQKPDLIILDVMMPDMNGGEVARDLQIDEETKDIPIIFLTITLSKKDKKAIEVQGKIYRAIAKPFYPPELLSAVRKILRQKDHLNKETP